MKKIKFMALIAIVAVVSNIQAYRVVCSGTGNIGLAISKAGADTSAWYGNPHFCKVTTGGTYVGMISESAYQNLINTLNGDRQTNFAGAVDQQLTLNP